jgi:flagellar secretion chaperone FliS
MTLPSRNQYLESKVATASAHRLHLMLIEGAIRFGRQAEDALRRGDMLAAAAPLMRVVDIVGEMLAGVRGQDTELNRKIADLYLFLFRRVAEAKINDDVEKLAEALRLLDFERETWQLACDKLTSQDPGSAAQRQVDKKGAPRPNFIGQHLGGRSQSSATSSGLSLEA